MSLLAPTASATLNVPVAARVMSFVQPAPSGIIPVAIVYQAGNGGSEAETSEMEHALVRNSLSGQASIRTRRVPVSNLAQLSDMRAAFVTSGLRNYQSDLAETASAQPLRPDAEAVLHPRDHAFSCGHLCLAHGGARFHVHDDGVVEVNEAVGRLFRNHRSQ